MCVFVGSGVTEAEINFMFGDFNMIEPPLVNIPCKPKAWKRYKGWNVNLRVIYFKRIKLFSVPKAKKKIGGRRKGGRERKKKGGRKDGRK